MIHSGSKRGDERVRRVREGAAVWRRIEDETVVLALDSSLYLAMNPAATELWPMLIDGATRAELASRLQTVFGIEKAQAEGDVDAFLDVCDDHRLLV